MTTHEKQFSAKNTNFSVISEQILKLYSFFDVKTNQFLPPFFSENDSEAIRQASNIVNFSNSLICKFPEDYQLYFMGVFSQKEGTIFSDENYPLLISRCQDLKTEKSLQYDELLKECTKQQEVIRSLISTIDNMKSDLDKRIQQEYKNKSLELYTPVEKTNSKKSILSKLFNN